TVTVKNTSTRAGEEVVQVYVSHENAKQKSPVRSLQAFQRIHLDAGESRQLTFTLSPEQLSLVNEKTGALFQPDGRISISVGGGQPGVKNKTTSNVITGNVMIK